VIDANGNSTLNSLQAGAMGEAWSDWYAFDFLAKEGFVDDAPNVGDVRVGHCVGGGLDLIRTEPLDCTPSMTAAQGCPGGVATGEGGYTYGDVSNIIGIPEVHADGEIWGQPLWQIRGNLGLATTEALVTEAMSLSPDDPTMLDMRNAVLAADEALFGGSHVEALWADFASRGMGFFAAAIDGSDFLPEESFALPPDPAGPKGSLAGAVTDAQTGATLAGAEVAFGGHDSGLGIPNLLGTTDSAGEYTIGDVPFGTYPKVNVFAAGYDRDAATIAVDGAETKDWSVLRDWISGPGGAQIRAATGTDFSAFFCGPDKAIDQTGNGWLNTADITGGAATPKSLTVELPQTIDVTEFLVDPSHPCGVGGSASTGEFRIETSPDGTAWTTAAAGTFTAANRYQLNTVAPTAGTTDVRWVRFTMITPQVPGGTAPTVPARSAAARSWA
jgi:extracellular elastinolytic metalloproteinase